MSQQPAATQFVIQDETWEWFSGIGGGWLTSLCYGAHGLLGCGDAEKVSAVSQPLRGWWWAVQTKKVRVGAHDSLSHLYPRGKISFWVKIVPVLMLRSWYWDRYETFKLSLPKVRQNGEPQTRYGESPAISDAASFRGWTPTTTKPHKTVLWGHEGEL